MRFVLTLIAGRPDVLTPELATVATASLLASGAEIGPTVWLAPGLACDIPFEAPDPEDHGALPARLPSNLPLDLAIQPAEGRRKALLVADLESTIIGQEMLDELAEAVGLRDRIAGITARAMAGELDFAEALNARVGLLKGLPAGALDEAGRRMTLNPGARTLVQTLRAAGAATALVSGGFTCFAEPIAAACGFETVVANRLLVEDGRLTGRVAEPLVDRDAKLATLERLAAEHGLTMDAACAVGDGANDAAMLAAAGLGVAYRGKPAAQTAARVSIDHGDLTALLYLQGYRREEFRD
ncbi:MAG: phosphoserine phosphatase SerB [Rhodospirillales bacterium]|nr:phosphoserine phosphatase SerB [Rhodospirillales bacterium]MDH3912122.1 phosphoserine phosphatase SerB [Rhodospirillales bacterium]MDH3917823.1 phosphoserine phosphatase SerB [Rhodospirillales bacterium]MDH3969637.1 phosphoserine phosphatase SerB [Rhodospirillales bacterium]